MLRDDTCSFAVWLSNDLLAYFIFIVAQRQAARTDFTAVNLTPEQIEENMAGVSHSLIELTSKPWLAATYFT